MKPLPHIYSAQLSGGAEGYAVVSVAGIPDLRTAVPTKNSIRSAICAAASLAREFAQEVKRAVI